MTKKEIEEKIESIGYDIFIIEMKDHMTNDDFVQLAQLNTEKADLINTLKGMN